MGLFGKKPEYDDPPALTFPLDLDRARGKAALLGAQRVPRVGEVLGLDDFARQQVKEIIKRVNHPDVYEKYSRRETQGYLFAGPPGTGKSMLTKAIARACEDNAFVYTIKPEVLVSSETGGLRKNIQNLFAEVAGKAITQDDVDVKNGRGIRRLFNSPKSKKTLIFIMDEFEQLVLDKTGESGVDLSYEQFGAVNDMLRGLDEIQGTVTNVLFLFTTNYPHLIEEAVRDRLTLLRFYDPDDITLKHMIIQTLSNIMYKLDDNESIFSPTLVKAVKAYREVSERLSDAQENGNDEAISKAKKELSRVYQKDMEEELAPAIAAASGFSGRDVERAVKSIVDQWIAEGIDARGGIFSKNKPTPIGRDKLALAMHLRKQGKAIEENPSRKKRSALRPGL